MSNALNSARIRRRSAGAHVSSRADHPVRLLRAKSGRRTTCPIITAAVRASPLAGTSYTALGEASRPCDPGARKCQSSMASGGA